MHVFISDLGSKFKAPKAMSTGSAPVLLSLAVLCHRLRSSHVENTPADRPWLAGMEAGRLMARRFLIIVSPLPSGRL